MSSSGPKSNPADSPAAPPPVPLGRSLVVTPQASVPLAELQFSFVRSSGPGGQNVNKVASKAVLRWAVRANSSLPSEVRHRFLTQYASRLTTAGELILTSQRYRDQPRNEEDCLEKLRQMLLVAATPPKRRKKTKPTRGSKERRLKDKKADSGKKQLRRNMGRGDF